MGNLDEAKTRWPWLSKNSPGFINAADSMDLASDAVRRMLDLLELHNLTWEEFSLPVHNKNMRIQSGFLWNLALTKLAEAQQKNLLQALQNSKWANSFSARAMGVSAVEVEIHKTKFGNEVVKSCWIYLDRDKVGVSVSLAPWFADVLGAADIKNLDIRRIMVEANAVCADPIRQMNLNPEDLRKLLKALRPEVDFDNAFSVWIKSDEAKGEGIIAYRTQPSRMVVVEVDAYETINNGGMLSCDLTKFISHVLKNVS